jgi:hypothetical protein
MAKIPKIPPEVWERQRQNRERLRRLLEQRLIEDERIRAAKEAQAAGGEREAS